MTTPRKESSLSANSWQPVAGRVSIVIPTYNYGEYLGEAISSCLRQSYPDLEIVVVDDGSTDNTRTVCDSFGNKIVYIHQENKGVSAARNAGLERISGEFVTFLDSDDFLTPDSVKVRVAVLRQHSEIGMAMGGVISRDNYDPSLPGPSGGQPYFSDKYYENLLIGRLSASGLLRATIARNYRFPENITNGEDVAYFVKVSFSTKVCVLDDTVLVVRRHAGSLRRDFEKIAKQDIALISTIMDDPFYKGGLEYLRRDFTAKRYLSLFRSLYLAGDHRTAIRYYLQAVRVKPASLLVFSKLTKFLRACWRLGLLKFSQGQKNR